MTPSRNERDSTRTVERFALAGMVLGIALLAIDRLRHRLGFVLFIPRGARAAGLGHATAYVLRTRPALIVGFIAIIAGLGAALYAGVVQLAQLVSARRESR